MSMTSEERDPIATYEALKLPDWEWEVFEVEQRDAGVVVDTDASGEPVTETTDIYHGRVKSPMTYGRWEYGSFTTRDLQVAGAYRTDGGEGFP